MKVYMQWHGGSSYAAPHNTPEDTEVFDSLADARAEFRRRECGYDPYYPCVEGSSAWIFFSDPTETSDPYPDRVFELGPRGGLVESCG